MFKAIKWRLYPTNKPPGEPAVAADIAAARRSFAEFCFLFREMVSERAVNDQFCSEWGSEIISSMAGSAADPASELQRAQSLHKQRMVKVLEDRDDARRRIDEVAAAFAANERPDEVIDNAVAQLEQVFLTPKNSPVSALFSLSSSPMA